jgi:hypothetical protein
LYIEAKFSNYGEVGVVREIQKERPNEITGTTGEEEKAVVGDRNRNWGSNRNEPALLRSLFFPVAAAPEAPAGEREAAEQPPRHLIVFIIPTASIIVVRRLDRRSPLH